jgi:ketol-acid reductoisomerase
VREVVIGLRAGSARVVKAEFTGFKVMDPAEAAKRADVVMVLTPNEGQGDLDREKLHANMKEDAPSPSPMARVCISTCSTRALTSMSS